MRRWWCCHDDDGGDGVDSVGGRGGGGRVDVCGGDGSGGDYGGRGCDVLVVVVMSSRELFYWTFWYLRRDNI